MRFHVMLPFYGSFDHFRAAVSSVLEQSHADLRLTVVDDVYPDEEPGRWLQGLGDDRVSYIRNDSNLGVSRNYLKCVGLMEGSHSILMGCDDVMLPDFVARVVSCIERFPAADVIQPGVEVIDGDGAIVHPLADRVKHLLEPRGPKPLALSGQALARSLARANWTYFPSLVWKVETIRRIGFRAHLDIVQDIGMLLDIAREGGTLVLDDRTVFQYRRHASSVSATTAVSGKRFQQEREIFDEQAALLAEQGWRSASRAASWRLTSRLNALTQLPSALRTRDVSGRRALLRHALR